MSWASLAIESGGFFHSGSIDALVDAPLPGGTLRSRRLDPAVVNALAHEASKQGSVVRTPGKLAKVLHRMAKRGRQRLGTSTADKALVSRMGVYLASAKE
eukprot:915866-Lingulodinium_polyedra.AAC.1